MHEQNCSGVIVMGEYEKLVSKFKPIVQFSTAMGIISWDLQTQMPPKGLQQRSEQLAVMSKILHNMSTNSEIGTLLTALEEKQDSLDYIQKREVELIRRNWNRRATVPDDLVVAEVKQRTIATASWKKAKATNDWKLFAPELEKLLEMSRTKAEKIMEPVGAKTPYDALMDIYEPKMSAENVSSVFSDLRRRLVPLVKKYSDICYNVTDDFMDRKLPIEQQRELITDLANYVGYDTLSDNAGGRIDEAEHPFTTGYYDDVRMTIHYFEDDVFRAVFGGLHEAGHAIHGQNRNPEWKWMALGGSSSSGISESQSRFIENIVGRSPEFWQQYQTRFNKCTHQEFKDISHQELTQAINIVKPTKIRVTADEMTYALHIIIRFEIELDLFQDKLTVSDIPQIWNEKYEKYLGVEIENDSEGALQDTHWAWAYWGYFPTYALGNLYSAMILERMEKDVPNWKDKVSQGSISPVIDWLDVHVHKPSNRYDPSRMIEEITGKKITAKPFINYLENKYSALFG